MSRSAEQTKTDAPLPGEATRTVLSLLLVLHLFLAIVSIVVAMPVAQPSEMVVRLNNNMVAPLGYPEWLLMRSYAFSYTQSIDTDWDTEAEVLFDWQEGDERRPERVERLERAPLADYGALFLPARKQRYLALAGNTAATVGIEGRESLLTKSIADALLAEHDYPEGAHRFRLRRVPTPLPGFYGPEAAAPQEAVVFQADLVVRDGRLSFTKAEQRSLSSPVNTVAPPEVNPPRATTPAIPDPLNPDLTAPRPGRTDDGNR